MAAGGALTIGRPAVRRRALPDASMSPLPLTGGCTAAATCGLAVLAAIREERLQDNAARVGAYCLRRLRELQVGGWVGGVRLHV